MLTAWGKKCMAVIRNTNVVPNVTISNASEAGIEAKDIAGNTHYIPPAPYSVIGYAIINSEMVLSGTNASIGVAFGADNTTPTENDYTIGDHITGLTAPTPTIETLYDTVNHRYVAMLQYTLRNDTGTDVTIREVGLFGKFGSAEERGNVPSSTASSRYSFMIDRTVFPSPVTIPNGEARVVRYEFAYQG